MGEIAKFVPEKDEPTKITGLLVTLRGHRSSRTKGREKALGEKSLGGLRGKPHRSRRSRMRTGGNERDRGKTERRNRVPTGKFYSRGIVY